ncbi:hypothetical protein SFC65_19965 [Priestia filamentosa]|uniref:hypothetical protein n=1 Tax=Priestia filamentosa TaxID=1402861 RepID=UPI00398207CB
MVLEHQLNIQKSKEVYKALSHSIEIKQCYNNVYNVLTSRYRKQFSSRKWKIAYGYLSSIENIMVRHCFIIDEEGKAIDPTIIATNRLDRAEFPEYISFVVLDEEEYIKELEEAHWYPTLYTSFQEEVGKALEWARVKERVLV